VNTKALLRAIAWLAPVGLVFGTRTLGLLQPVEWAVYDALLVARPAAPPSPHVLVVGFTEDDIARFGHPIADGVLAEVLQAVESAEPVAIGLDLYRDQPVPPGTDRLATVLEQSDRVYGVERIARPPDAPIPSPPALADRSGTTFLVLDGDSILRRALLYGYRTDGSSIPSLPLLLADRYLDEQYGITAKPREGGLQIGAATFFPFEAHDGPYAGADAGEYQIPLSFRGPSDRVIPFVSAGELLDGTVPSDRLRDRVVIVGMTAVSVPDQFATPFSRDLSLSPQFAWGAEVHAHTTDAIVAAALGERPPLRLTPDWLAAILAALWSGAAAVVVFRTRSPAPGAIALRGVAIGAVLAIATVGSSYGALVAANWWVSPVPPVLSALVVAATAVNLVYIERLRDRARHFEREVEERTQQLVVEERIGLVGRFAAGYSHQARNALQGIGAHCRNTDEFLRDAREALQTRPLDETLRRDLDECFADVLDGNQLALQPGARLTRLSDLLLASVRGRDQTQVTVPVNTLVRESYELVRETLPPNRDAPLPDCRFDLDPALDRQGLGDDLQQVSVNLIANSFDALARSDESRPEIVLATRASTSAVEVTVTDNGPGIPAAVQDRLFEPFFTTTRSGEGLGLGLFVARAIVENYGGRIDCSSQPGKTTFRVTIPALSSRREVG